MTYVVKKPADFFRVLNRSFDSNLGKNAAFNRTPNVDVRETEEGYIIDAELPGLTEKDIDVKIENRNLFISTMEGEKKEKDKGDNYLIREREIFSFSRNFILPKDSDSDSIYATFKNGILSIEIKKRPESKPKSIKVKAA